jgi:hypothetical protein
LENAQLKHKYKMELRNRFETLNHSDENTEETRNKIEGIYMETAKNILGFREIKKKDWLSEETWTKIQKTGKKHKNDVEQVQNKKQKTEITGRILRS